jgi:hypothetical protein
LSFKKKPASAGFFMPVLGYASVQQAALQLAIQLACMK